MFRRFTRQQIFAFIGIGREADQFLRFPVRADVAFVAFISQHAAAVLMHGRIHFDQNGYGLFLEMNMRILGQGQARRDFDGFEDAGADRTRCMRYMLRERIVNRGLVRFL
jgi:hypothetical protein